jgi:hypothetical protein
LHQALPKNLGVHWNLADLDWLKQEINHPFEQDGWVGRSYVASGINVWLAGETQLKIEEGRAVLNDVRGWQSRRYGVREPCLGIDLSLSSSRARFFAAFAPNSNSEPQPKLVRAMLNLLTSLDLESDARALLALLGETI